MIVEGEAKVDVLRSWNMPATCNAGGARKWKPEHSEFLRGADVIILPDNDERRPRARDVVGASLLGIAAGVHVLELPGLGPKGDIIDWIKAGGTASKFHELRAGSQPMGGTTQRTRNNKASRSLTRAPASHSMTSTRTCWRTAISSLRQAKSGPPQASMPDCKHQRRRYRRVNGLIKTGQSSR